MKNEIVASAAIMAAGLSAMGESALPTTETALFAGGCFWCMEPPFSHLDGVIDVFAGYTGGHKKNPTYDEVSSGTTGHLEAIAVHYDPKKVSYDELLDVFWKNVDPTDAGGQFADRGHHYMTTIFYMNEEQRIRAEKSKSALDKSKKFDKPIVTPIVKAGPFYKAEAYHQDYYVKSPDHYYRYKEGSGRGPFIKMMWGDAMKKDGSSQPKNDVTHKPSKDELKGKLTKMQFAVAIECGTEPPFKNEYWDNHREGIYVDVVSGNPLFSSKDKFDSGTGWPSFVRPLDEKAVGEIRDSSHGMVRTEVRSMVSDIHLGHVFEDGPAPTGLRYCMNSASMRFIAKEDLEKEGYGKYLSLF